MSKTNPDVPARTEKGSDLVAVRRLMAEVSGAPGPIDANHQAQLPAPPTPQKQDAQVSRHAAHETPATGGRSLLARLMSWGMNRAQSYRPNRKVIFWTSAALLVVLYPGAVMGGALLICILSLALYLIIGEERFWRGVITAFRGYARKRPQSARLLKVRAYLAAKRWDCAVSWLPESIANVLRMPDLRAIVAADARHEAALCERLGRLHGDRAI